MKELEQVENEFETIGNIDPNDIINVTLAKNKPNLKRKFDIQVILKGAISLMIITTLMGFLFGFAEDPDFRDGHFQVSQINLTEKQTTMTTTGSECYLKKIVFPFL